MKNKCVRLVSVILYGQNRWSTGGDWDTKTDQALFLVELLEFNLSHIIMSFVHKTIEKEWESSEALFSYFTVELVLLRVFLLACKYQELCVVVWLTSKLLDDTLPCYLKGESSWIFLPSFIIKSTHPLGSDYLCQLLFKDHRSCEIHLLFLWLP